MNWIFVLTLFLVAALASKSKGDTALSGIESEGKSHFFPCVYWKWAYGGNVPGKSFEAGSDSENSPIYLA